MGPSNQSQVVKVVNEALWQAPLATEPSDWSLQGFLTWKISCVWGFEFVAMMDDFCEKSEMNSSPYWEVGQYSAVQTYAKLSG